MSLTPRPKCTRWKAKCILEERIGQLRQSAYRYHMSAAKNAHDAELQLGAQAVADGLYHAADVLENFVEKRFIGVEKPPPPPPPDLSRCVEAMHASPRHVRFAKNAAEDAEEPAP